MHSIETFLFHKIVKGEIVWFFNSTNEANRVKTHEKLVHVIERNPKLSLIKTDTMNTMETTDMDDLMGLLQSHRIINPLRNATKVRSITVRM